MMKRFAPVAVAGLTLVGCAAPAPSEEVAMDPELAQIWQALSVQDCSDEYLDAIAEAGLNPFAQADAAIDYTECLATVTADTAEGAIECTLDDLECTLDGVGALGDIEAADMIIDCQQQVLDCTAGVVDEVVEVDLGDVVDVVNGTVDDVQDLGDDVIDVVDDTVGDAVDNVLSQVECNEEAAACLADTFFWEFSAIRECRVAFVECSEAVLENAVEDAVDTVQDTVDIVTGPQDCSGVYEECRADGGGVLACIRERRECETN